MITTLRDNDRCYVCGKKNPSGLAVDFAVNKKERSIRGVFTPLEYHQGFEGIIHGGIISSLLDEAMAKLVFSIGIPAVTAEIVVKFRHPASPGEKLIVFAGLIRETNRLITAEARIERGQIIIAEAKGKLLRIADKKETTEA